MDVTESVRARLEEAIECDDVQGLGALLSAQPLARSELNGGGGRPLIAGAKSVSCAEVMLEHGASLDRVSAWWAPGFGVIGVDAAVGAFLVDRGAGVSAHAAAGLGLVDVLSGMIRADGSVVHSKGGDGGTPLQFARTVDIMELLLAHGADPDARDDDHDSTPLQWLVTDAPCVARALIEVGATPDVFAASALGDLALVERLTGEDSRIIGLRVGFQPEPALAGYENLGGTVYQWTLGFNRYAHQYAHERGHAAVFELLCDRSDARTRFLVACVMADRAVAEKLAREQPGLVGSLSGADLELLARYCWETNADVEAARLMLDLGWPIDVPETRHAFSPLHNAAWGGYADLVDLLIERGAPVDLRDQDYSSTPYDYAMHCCCDDGRHPEGEYTRVLGALIDAGSPWDPSVYPTGHPKVDAALEPRLGRNVVGLAVRGDLEAVRARMAGASGDDLALALCAAAHAGHVEMCEFLLDSGVVMSGATESGLTPLHKAVSGGALDAARFLLGRGADARAKNLRGSSPLHTAALVGASREMVDVLIKGGASAVLDDPNEFGATALGWAIENGFDETESALRAHGARDESSGS